MFQHQSITIVIVSLLLLSAATAGTALAAAEDVSREDADAELVDGTTYYQGQVLYRDGLEPGEIVEVRHVDPDRSNDRGLLEKQTAVDADGEILIDTLDLPADQYILEDSNNDEVARFEVIVHRISTFEFDEDEVTNGGSEATTFLQVVSNRANYRHQIYAERNGREVDVDDLRDVVEEPILSTADPDGDGTDEALVLRGRSSQEIDVNFTGSAPGTWNFTTAVADSTATATASVDVLGGAGPFPTQIPGTGAGSPPTDPNGDGRYEDVDGDGDADFGDAIALAFADFATINADVDQQAALDFDGDGDVDFADAVDLAFRV